VENSLIESLLTVCKTLNGNSVEYLIVGGTAVALHGFYRQSHDPSGDVMTKHDLDFWYNPTYDNYYRLLDALQELGQDITEFKEEVAPNPKTSFFRFEEENFKIDFLPEILGLAKFRTSFDNGINRQIQGIEVRYLNYSDLIESKKALSRTKDVEDMEQLKLRNDTPDKP
jgi:predicted nucleotidyltransferase